MNTSVTSRKSKPSASAAALAVATNLALAHVTPGDGDKTPPTPANQSIEPPTGRGSGQLTRATITLRDEDVDALDCIESYLRGIDRRLRLPRAMIVQIALRSVKLNPELLEIARRVKAQDARGRKNHTFNE